jgi:hypothetical protein
MMLLASPESAFSAGEEQRNCQRWMESGKTHRLPALSVFIVRKQAIPNPR